jgi:class 3 adenylate cyclase/tetratricopeptide (TPR) repeat protein
MGHPTERKERRYVTVLFSDLKGFSTLAEGMDPEDVEQILDDLLGRFRRAIEAEEGTVDKFIGDAVMAVWGAPRAHEDDALRAVRTGVNLQNEMSAFNSEKGLELKIRVGINSGEVLWGQTGGGQWTATGDVVNVAQRLEGCCEPGRVTVSESVYRVTRSRVRYRKLDAVRVKGREEPVQPFETSEILEEETAFRRIRTPIVGRERELNWIKERFKNPPAFLWIEGEAGIGKSRLAIEFLQSLPERTTVLRARCTPEMLGGFAPIGEALRVWAGGDPVARMAEALQADGLAGADLENSANLIGRAIGIDLPGARVADLPPERIGPERRLAFRALFAAMAKDRPLVLLVEDIHWVDSETPALLEDLAENLKERSVVVLTTSRPGERRLRGFEPMVLEGLPGGAVRSIGARIFGAPPGPNLERFLQSQAEGNPYFVEELASFLKENNCVSGDPPELASDSAQIPSTLQSLLIAKIDALEETEKETIKSASVIGRVFWENLLGRALEREVEREIRAAQSKGIVFEQPDSYFPGDLEFVFRHSLLRDAAYSLLTKKDRRTLHGLVADRLERDLRRDPRLVPLCAAHRELSGDLQKGAGLWIEASRAAFGEGKNEEAVRFGQRALDCGAGSEARLAVARACMNLSRFKESQEQIEILLGDPAAKSDEKARAYVALHHCLYRQGRNEAALEALDSAIRHAESRRTRCAAIQGRAWIFYLLDRLEEAVAECEKFKSELAEGDNQEAAAMRWSLLNTEANICFKQGNLERALELHESGLNRVRGPGLSFNLAVALNNCGMVLEYSGKISAALDRYLESLEIKRRIGDRFGVATTQMRVAEITLLREGPERAIALLEESVALSRSIGAAQRLGSGLIGLGSALLERRRPEDIQAAQAISAELLQMASGAKLPELEIGGWGLRARAASCAGRKEEAEAGRAAFREALERTRRSAVSSLEDLRTEGQILSELGRPEEAARVGRKLVDVALAQGAMLYVLWGHFLAGARDEALRRAREMELPAFVARIEQASRP